MALPLPYPSLVARGADVAMERTSPEHGAVHSHKIRAASLTTYTLTYLNKRDAARQGILEHFFANFREPWEWIPPTESTAVEVTYLAAPRAQRVGHTWTITVVLQTTL